MSVTAGAGPDVKKHIPSKRMKAGHLRFTKKAGGRISLRAWARAAFDQGSLDE